MAIDDPVKGIEEAPAAPTAETPRSTWSALRPLLLRIHFYAGVLVAPVLLVAAVTGLLYSLSFQAEKYVYSHELTTEVGDRTLPLAAQVAAARTAHPEGTVTAVLPSAEAGATTRVLMSSPEVEEGTSLAVFVDPYTGRVRGELADSFGALPLRAWLSGLHSNLHLGEAGRIYSELAASWLWVVALGGVLLWIGRKRASKRALLVPARGAQGRRRTLSWHGSVGLWAVAGLVALSATGLTWSAYAGEHIGTVQDRLGGATPTVSAALGAGGGDAHGDDAHQGPDVGIDEAVEAAAARGVEGAVSVTLPSDGNGYVVKETDRQFPVHLDSVAIDPSDGTVVDELRFDDYPLLAKLTRIGIDAHMGTYLGLANQLALAALALALIMLIVWGYRMWWLRRPTKSRTFGVGRPMPRGAWRRVPLPVLLPLAAVTALVGWFVPLLGISLAAFLVLDVVLGLVARSRAGAGAGA
ncbi:PepSY-associated TM helix domain-containing protein [Streptomyces sp. NPDC059176]|uniref:PepSY-associated TM helix domain-containing protein n=1 Tax=unclassified Streptomyces TaxID=2593676 RepID=UPI003699C104